MQIGSTEVTERRMAIPVRRTSWRVLVVEGSRAESESLIAGLRSAGHDGVIAEPHSTTLRAYNDVDLIVLDLDLLGVEGMEIYRAIWFESDTPVIAVTAHDDEHERVLALRAGADDCLVKPYGFAELLARIDAVMRRSRPQSATLRPISRGPLDIDPRARKVAVHGRPVVVTRKEFDLLYMLAANPDRVISRQRLMRDIWEDSWSRRTVDTHVSALRNKLGSSSWVVTVRGVGFRIGHA